MTRVRPVPLTTRPTVSVVIPCYNYGRYLPAAVAGALDQRGVDVDVLIVDDASLDDSAETARHLAASDPRVDVLVHTINTGHIQTYNDGLAKVSGDYVALVSADDMVAPDALTRAASLMEHHPEVGFVYGFSRSFEGEPPAAEDRIRNWSIWGGREWLGLAARRGRCFISSPEVVMRREALMQTSGYDPRLPHSGDFDMWMRTAARWDVGRVNGPVQAFYRVHDHNMHLTTYAGWVTDLRERRTTFEILFDERASDLPEVTSLRPTAMRALARESLRRALIAHRDHPGSEAVASHIEFAVETCPAIVRTPLWRVCELGPLRERRFPGEVPRRFATRVREHLQWRRRRRYGT